jgi:hypothetical protein
MKARYNRQVPDVSLPQNWGERMQGFKFLHHFNQMPNGRDALIYSLLNFGIVAMANGCLLRVANEGHVTLSKVGRCRLSEVLWAIYNPQSVVDQPKKLPRPICGEEWCVNLQHLRMRGMKEGEARAICQTRQECCCDYAPPCIININQTQPAAADTEGVVMIVVEEGDDDDDNDNEGK